MEDGRFASGRRYFYSPVHTQRSCGCAGYGGADDAYVYVMRVCIRVYDAWRTYAYVMRGMCDVYVCDAWDDATWCVDVASYNRGCQQHLRCCLDTHGYGDIVFQTIMDHKFGFSNQR